ncbi:MAG: beta-propeller fold lactonase family protein [Mariprofundaceae bacterium]
MKSEAIIKLLQLLVLMTVSVSASADTMVYMPLGTGNAVIQIDGDRDRLIGTIPGVVNSHGLDATRDGVYLVAGSLTESFAGGPPAKPTGMSEEEHRGHHGMPAEDRAQKGKVAGGGILYLINAREQRIVRQIEVPGVVHHVLITADGRFAVSTHPSLGAVSIVDLGKSKMIKTLFTGPAANFIVGSSDHRLLYVSNSGDNSIREVDIETWSVRRRLPAGQAPGHLTLSADGSTLYAVNAESGTVSAIDLKRGDVSHAYPVGADAHGMALSDDGRFLYVSSKKENKLTAIELASATIRSIPLSPAPYHVAAIPGTGKLYVSSRQAPKIWVIDAVTLKILREIQLSNGVAHQMVIRETKGGPNE